MCGNRSGDAAYSRCAKYVLYEEVSKGNCKKKYFFLKKNAVNQRRNQKKQKKTQTLGNVLEHKQRQTEKTINKNKA